MKKMLFTILLAVLIFASVTGAECPSADLSGDCKVTLRDFAIFASQWLEDGTPDPVAIDFATIPAGTFQMGDSFAEGFPSELPVHTVTLSAFQMSKHEITNGQYAEYLNAALAAGDIKIDSGDVYGNSSPYNDEIYYEMSSVFAYISRPDSTFIVTDKDGRNMDNDPVIMISWYGAKAFCDYYGYTLPTETQWEYAARDGQYTPYRRFPWGYDINHTNANYIAAGSAFSYDTSPYTTSTYHLDWDTIFPYTSPVATFSSNGYGLYDMTGNVFEWCSDWYGNYPSSPDTDPSGPISGSYRVIRGGGWTSTAFYCRVAYRGSLSPSDTASSYGFRVCN